MDIIKLEANHPLKDALESIWRHIGGPFTIKRIIEENDNTVAVHVQDNLNGYDSDMSEKFAKAMSSDNDIGIDWISPDANRPPWRAGGRR